MKFAGIFNHHFTTEQKKEIANTGGTIIELSEDAAKAWKSINPFGELDIESLKPLRTFLVENLCPGDYVLIQGEFGATFYLVEFCFSLGLIPVYSTTERKYEEMHNPDGSVERHHVFKHVNFRKYVKYTSNLPSSSCCN